MIVTIIADASHCPHTKVAGYGYWIISNRGRLGGGNRFKQLLPDCGTAEALAIVNSIYLAFSHDIAAKDDTLVIQSDSQFAINLLKGIYTPRNKAEIHALAVFNAYVSTNNCTTDFRHVKGHDTDNSSARSVTNKICDESAKLYMRTARKLFNKCPETFFAN